MKHRIVPVALILLVAVLLGWLYQRGRQSDDLESSTAGVSSSHDSVKANFGRLHPTESIERIDVYPPNLSEPLPEQNAKSDLFNHPAIQRRLRDLICYHSSTLASNPTAQILKQLAIQYGLAPDSLLDAYRLAWLNTQLRSPNRPENTARNKGRVAMLNVTFAAKSDAFQRRHGQVGEAFFHELAKLRPTIPPPDCGPKLYQLDNHSITQWIQADNFPEYQLGPDWFEDTASRYLKTHEDRLRERNEDPAFSSSTAQFIEALLIAQPIHPDDRTTALRTAMDHLHTMKVLQEQLQTVSSAFGADTQHADSPELQELSADMQRSMQGSYQERLDTYREIIEEVWKIEWGVTHSQFLDSLLSQQLEIEPRPRTADGPDLGVRLSEPEPNILDLNPEQIERMREMGMELP
jgi:hypothetical protein